MAWSCNFHFIPSYIKALIKLSPLPIKLRLSTAICTALILLVLPGFVFVLAFSYQRNRLASLRILADSIQRSQFTSIKQSQSYLQEPSKAISLLANFAVYQPHLFREPAGPELLYQGLISADQIDALYISFEDGYHRVVTRVDDTRRRSDPQIPHAANWHTSFVDPFRFGLNRRRHRIFFDHWPNRIANYSVSTSLDMRTLNHYKYAKATRRLFISQPIINPDTGSLVIALAMPIVYRNNFIGIIGANITMDSLSSFLEQNRASPNSHLIVADTKGTIIAQSTSLSRSISTNKLSQGTYPSTLLHNDHNWLREAYLYRFKHKRDSFIFKSSKGQELSISFLNFSPEFRVPWQVIVATPTHDFVGELQQTTRFLTILSVTVLLLEIFFISILSGRLARGVEQVTDQLRNIRELNFFGQLQRSSFIREVADLESGTLLLRSALESFANYVPLGVVQQLVRTRQPLVVGMEPRPLSILFADLVDFSSHAECMEPTDLVSQVSAYFAAVTDSICEQDGTVDKFIGDAVMAFWGAPLSIENHALCACTAALNAVSRMESLNLDWLSTGKPEMHLRIGIHTDTVLVGNIGSTNRLSYTAMGDGVNVASRLEGKNKEYGTTIIISDSVLRSAGDSLISRPLGMTHVKGRRGSFLVHELLGIHCPNDHDTVIPSPLF